MAVAEPVFRSASRHRTLGILVVLALHALLLWLVSMRPPVGDSNAMVSRTDIVFIRPPPVVTVPVKPAAPLIPVPKTPSRIAPPTPVPRMAVENSTPDEPIAETHDIFSVDGPADNAKPLDPAELIRLAGKLDRDNRVPGENLLNTPEGKSLRQKIDDAFTNARLAVPPKWYEAARIELWSAPNDPARIYQVKTAFGTFCLYYPDKNKMAQGGGSAQFGQPRMASCPKRF